MTSSRTHTILAEVFAAASAPDKDLLGLLSAACVRDLPVDGAGISLLDDHGVRLRLTATDERARTLEELQFTLGEGPCLDAFAAGRMVTEPDLEQCAQRWPQFCPAAQSAGVGAVFALPLQLGGIRLGVLDLYRVAPGTLTDAQTVEALAFSDAATLVLLHLQDGARPGQLPADFDAAWMSQAEVHQATGMISVQANVTLADSLVALRARAFAESRPISEIASDVVEHRTTFAAGPEGE